MRDCSWRLLKALEQLRREDWVAEAIEEVAERQLTEGSEKRLLREEVAKRRGTSAKRSVSEEAAQTKKSRSLLQEPIHVSVYAFIHSFLPSFIHSLAHCFMALLSR